VVLRPRALEQIVQKSEGVSKALAEDLATRVDGVLAVKNNIQVNAEHASKSDIEIKKYVQDAIIWDPLFDSEDQVVIKVRNGRVTLTGVVDTWAQLTKAA
jgi:osmotically-inducible protein OsmY